MQDLENGPVIVVGAGLSGLVAAWKLKQAGVDVIVLEAGDRVGGRTLTTTEGWQDGQYADLGGEIIDRSYHALTSLCREIGVEMSEPLSYMRSEPGDLSVVEGYLRVGLFKVGERFLDRGEAQAVSDEIRRAAQEYKPVSHEVVEQWIRRARLSPDAAAVVRSIAVMLCQLDPWDCDVHFVFGAASPEFRRILGGTQQIALTLARDLDIRLNSTVVRVQRHGQVRVRTEDGREFIGRRVICATGPYAMATVGFDPPLPDEKVMTVLSLLPAMGGKVLAQYAEGDLVRNAFRDVVYTDGPINAAWIGSPQVTTGPALVAAFITGHQRHVLADTDASLAVLDALVSQAVRAPVTRLHGEVKNWWADPLAKGVTVTPANEARQEIASTLAATERRTHVAGDYTDPGMAGTLEGAVRSGLRVADEVLRTPKRFHITEFNERLAIS